MKGFFLKIEYELLIFSFLMVKMFYELPYYKLTLSISAVIVFCVFISYVLAKFVRNANEAERKTVIIFVAFLLGSSILSGIIFVNNFIDRGLTFKNIIFVFCFFVAFESIDKTPSKLRIPIICFACCAIDPAYIFIFIPAIAILLLYNFYSSTQSAESVWLIVASLIATVAALILFRKEIAFANNLNIIRLVELNWKNIVYSLIIVLPFILILNIIWINIIKSSTDKKFKLIVILIMLEPLISIFSLAFDKKYIDLVMASAFVQVCFLFYFLYIKNNVFLDAFNKISKFLEKNILLVIIILIYISAFSLFNKNSHIGNWLGY